MAILDFSDPPFAAPPFVPPSKPSDWTDLRISTLRKLWSEGLSGAQIAIKLWEITRYRFTRSAVIGKASRLKLPGRIPAGGRPRKPRRERLAKRRERWAIRKLTEPTYHTVEVIELPPEDLSNTVTFAQLTEHTCKWPHGDPGDEDFCFCGAEIFPDKPYCARHCRMAYAPSRVRG